MLISTAWAHGASAEGTTGGGTAVLIILAAVATGGFAYSRWRKWRRRVAAPEAPHEDNG